MAEHTALLPCPFCGGPHISDRHVRDGRQMFCINCGASVAATYHGPAGDTIERARQAWNTRAAAPAVADLVKALEPFARIPLMFTDDIDDSATVFEYEGGAITLGHLRRVHTALSRFRELEKGND